MERLFGTDGIRGVANLSPLTPEMALKVGRATAYACQSSEPRRHKIVVGNDTRHSGAMLQSALAAGVCSMGFDVLLAGTMPTPGIAFLTRNMGADGGIVISASHNPYQDNGIKIFSRDGYKLRDAQEDEIEDLVTSGRVAEIRPTGNAIGSIKLLSDAEENYIRFCIGTLPLGLNLKGLKVVLDCANGATYRVAPGVFSEIGAEVTAIHCEPDGMNINDRCGSQNTESLAAKVSAKRADLGLAFDGDGDRMIAIDENGRELTGDHTLAICSRLYKERGWLKNNLVVSTVMSNCGFSVALKKLGIEHAVAVVGDRYVLEMMKEKGAVIGGEPSGHTIFLNHHTTGDGIISSLQLLSAMLMEGARLSQMSRIMQMLPQKIINVDVKSKPPLTSIPGMQKAIQAAEAELNNQGRVLIRYSGTQAMCRVMVEGPTMDLAERLVRSLAEIVKKNIG
jgi:phosphoglucosamine mutase